MKRKRNDTDRKLLREIAKLELSKQEIESKLNKLLIEFYPYCRKRR